MVYYDNSQIKNIREYFTELREEDGGQGEEESISINKLEEVLVSLGLAASRQEVQELIGGHPQLMLRSSTINFEQFLHILKEASVRNPRGVKGNFLIDKNLYYEPGVKRKHKSMDGQGPSGGTGPQDQDEVTQVTDEYIGNA